MIRPISIAALTVALCAVSTSLTAQLSGNFTIDPKGSGSRNYKTFGAAVFAFWKNGIKAPVTVTVASGTYTQKWGIVPIQGLSKPGALTFRSAVKHGAVLQPVLSPAIALDYSSVTTPIVGVVLDGFKFVSTIGISGITHSHDIEIKNCYFQGKSDTGVTATNLTRWNIHHCVFDKVRDPIIISLYDDCAIHHNDLRFDRGRGILATKSKIPLTGALRIYNNTFVGSLDNNRAALSLKSGAYGAEVSHNTFRIDGDSWEACLHVVGVLGKPTRVFSNVFVNTLRGGLLVTETTSRYELQLDGNLYYPKGGGAVVQLLFSSTNKWDLAGWQKVSGQEGSSMQADPRFLRTSDLRPAKNSPAIGKAVGTPSYVTDDFDGIGRVKKSTIGAFEGSTSKWEPFGAGCAGTGGKVPALLPSGDLRMGSTNFIIVVWKALGGAGVQSFLVVGATKQTTPFGGKCNLLVAPHVVLPFAMSGGAGAGNGSAFFPLNLPSASKFRGAKAHFQWAVIDSAATGGVAFTGAATLTL